MEEAIKKLTNNLSMKHFIPIYGETDNSDYTMEFNRDINLNDVNYKMGLIWLKATNSFFNINETNNNLKYYNGSRWKIIQLPPGGYNIDDINDRIKELVEINNDNKDAITLEADTVSLRTSFKLTNGYKINFNIEKTFNQLIGFNNVDIAQGLTYSTNTIELTTVKSLNFNCNLVSGFYVDGKTSNILYSSPVPAPLGYDFEITPKNIIWLPLSTKSFNSINFRITDNNNKKVNLRGYKLQFLVLIRQI